VYLILAGLIKLNLKVKADAPRAVKLYESSQMEELLTMGHAARPLVQDDWNAIQEALIAGL
jgi:hypothetical protein